MEASNKKNMALKLELWLSAKQAGGGNTPLPSPLRPVIHTTSSQRRVSGYLTAISMAEGAPKDRKKSFSRLSSSSSDDDLIKTSPGRSPSSILSSDSAKSPSMSKNYKILMPPKIEEVDNDEKENQPWQDQNVKPNNSCVRTNNLFSSALPTKPTGYAKNQLKETDRRQSIGLLPSETLTLPITTTDVDGRNLNFKKANRNENAKVFVDIDTNTPPKISPDFDVLNFAELLEAERQSQVKQDEFYHKNLTESENRVKVFQEELHAMMFLNSIQEQKINELEETISKDRLEQNETFASRAKKHKAEIKRLTSERASYEDRANEMIAQMGKQMSLLQSMAMSRIELLENDLMDERHKGEALRQEAITLKSAAAQVVKTKSSTLCKICEADTLYQSHIRIEKDRQSLQTPSSRTTKARKMSYSDTENDCSSSDETVLASDDEEGEEEDIEEEKLFEVEVDVAKEECKDEVEDCREKEECKEEYSRGYEENGCKEEEEVKETDPGEQQESEKIIDDVTELAEHIEVV